MTSVNAVSMHFLLSGIRFGGQKGKEKRAQVSANKSRRMNRINGHKPSKKAASNSNQGNLQWNSCWHRWKPLTDQEQNPEKTAGGKSKTISQRSIQPSKTRQKPGKRNGYQWKVGTNDGKWLKRNGNTCGNEGKRERTQARTKKYNKKNAAQHKVWNVECGV